MKETTGLSRIHLARNCAFAILLFVLLLAGCDGTGETEAPETESLPVNAVESSAMEGNYEETLTAFLDRDGSDGYAGDYVLVYRPALEGGSKPNEADPYLTDEIRQADPCYDLTDGDLW